ncbi:MAG: formylglycine-generating enzyme family protein, partial [Verrucomicrobiota bacterium]
MKKMLIGTLLVAGALSGLVQAGAGGGGKSGNGSSNPSPKSEGQKRQQAPNPPSTKLKGSVPNDTYNNGLTPLRAADWKDPGPLYPGGGFFRWVAAGDFKMGSPEGETGRSPDEALKDVKIRNPFWICDHEVTVEEFEKVRGYNPFYRNEIKQAPVVGLIWEEAVDYCKTLTEKYQALKVILPSQEFRLATSEEWEFAARARGAETGPWYGGGDLGDYAWFA